MFCICRHTPFGICPASMMQDVAPSFAKQISCEGYPAYVLHLWCRTQPRALRSKSHARGIQHMSCTIGAGRSPELCGANFHARGIHKWRQNKEGLFENWFQLHRNGIRQKVYFCRAKIDQHDSSQCSGDAGRQNGKQVFCRSVSDGNGGRGHRTVYGRSHKGDRSDADRQCKKHHLFRGKEGYAVDQTAVSAISDPAFVRRQVERCAGRWYLSAAGYHRTTGYYKTGKSDRFLLSWGSGRYCFPYERNSPHGRWQGDQFRAGAWHEQKIPGRNEDRKHYRDRWPDRSACYQSRW